MGAGVAACMLALPPLCGALMKESGGDAIASPGAIGTFSVEPHAIARRTTSASAGSIKKEGVFTWRELYP